VTRDSRWHITLGNPISPFFGMYAREYVERVCVRVCVCVVSVCGCEVVRGGARWVRVSLVCFDSFLREIGREVEIFHFFVGNR